MRRHVAHLLLALSAAVAVGYPSRRSAPDLDATPRLTITYKELSHVQRFGAGAHNYTTLLLEDERGILYVGARGAIFALNASAISDGSHRTIQWEASLEKQADCLKKGKNNKTECFNHVRFLQRLNGTHLYACGTYAFHPLCAAIHADRFVLPGLLEEGKEKCPYDPARGYTGLIVDGGLYTATRYEFRSLPDVRRNLHQRPLKTEESPLHWLDDAEFVSSALVRESERSPVGDDDKIYFFFTERAGEEGAALFGKGQAARVARVARVCKGDAGGQKILQRKWTTFLKARLACYVPYYELLQSVCSLDGGAWPNTVFYAAFTLVPQWRSMEVSAVCRYDLSALQRAFDGPYMEYQDAARKWARYEGEVPEPRPGACITARVRHGGFNSSQDLPNVVLDFVKLHPLVWEEVGPAGGAPLLLKKGARYTRVVADRVPALDGLLYDVLFLGTGDGWLHRAVVVGSSVHIIEELQVFKDPQPVENLVISQVQRSVYVGAADGVVQLPLAACARYGSCYECVLARDPYCAWDGARCAHLDGAPHRARLVQDVQRGNEGCGNDSNPAVAARKTRRVLRGDDVLLPCDQPSNLARAVWRVNGSVAATPGTHFRVGVDGLLVTGTLPEHSGDYACYAEENGLHSLLAAYALAVLPTPPLSPPMPSAPLVPRAAGQALPDPRFLYIAAITVLGGLCLVLSTVLLYVACLQRRRGKYVLGDPRAATVELQTVSAGCLAKSRDAARDDGCLQIIPGEAPPPAPPPPPPPPPPAETPNGLSALPSVLRKMNGNSYMLLRQQDEPSTAAPLCPSSFAEELSKILEKRKHSQLVEKPDESSV
ncbi:semaphorin-4G [Alligator mississippiensis]|uniref:semaphorin-4G n=1 Tax=Alligator mississippiensis TaxID=8496 RepID=UPI0006EC7555|nr:semaphorin-4G [Alligator mississippiensis]XP_019341578.1 semaphorin-4G [Alligator mississippiensis]XP_019341579.1 semaphorin-4G [Alligator mississippiensis]XP_019341580.1 semaphorin-4G [Alligator mississippiensis]XP_019341581.1 semaphorin-4G [Alligator mississippiensis]XP_019341582.1 semaphorin-4G [Alligator mississippiensis]XP_019341583.1 semaphorin-4G [Alligator mississippiensis]XP_019341584.1 semaphorin-4G [Alligator mississippiensis]